MANHWTDEKIETYAKNIRQAHGMGWYHLAPSQRVAVVDSAVLSIIRSSGQEQVPMAKIDELHDKLHAAVGTILVGDDGELIKVGNG